MEQEYKKHAKADEISERYIELRKKDERVQSTLRAVKAEAERVKRELALAKRRAHEAKEAEKKWQEKETERLGKDKDSLLEKYLRSRSEHETQLRDMEHSMQKKIRSRSFKKLGQMARVSADSFGDDRYDDSYPSFDHLHRSLDRHSYGNPPRMGRPRRPHPDDLDDHPELLDDGDLPLDTFDSRPLMDKIKHLKRLQGQGECPDEQRGDHGSMYPGRGSYRGGYGRGSGHPLGDLSDLLPPTSGDSGKASRSKRLKSRPAKDNSDSTDGNSEKDEGDKKGDSGEYDYDSDQNNNDDGYGYEWGRVRGLSNQIEHVK